MLVSEENEDAILIEKGKRGRYAKDQNLFSGHSMATPVANTLPGSGMIFSFQQKLFVLVAFSDISHQESSYDVQVPMQNSAQCRPLGM